MHSRHTLPAGGALALSLLLTGCASAVPVPAECPRYVPSPEALAPITGTGWKPIAERVIETYSRPLSTP